MSTKAKQTTSKAPAAKGKPTKAKTTKKKKPAASRSYAAMLKIIEHLQRKLDDARETIDYMRETEDEVKEQAEETIARALREPKEFQARAVHAEALVDKLTKERDDLLYRVNAIESALMLTARTTAPAPTVTATAGAKKP